MFNGSGVPIRVCSIANGTDCVNLPANFSTGVMSWKEGQFTVEGQDCKRQYQLPAIENLEDFRESRSEPVNVVIGRSYELLLVHKGLKPEVAATQSQPPGFPVIPSPSGSACK